MKLPRGIVLWLLTTYIICIPVCDVCASQITVLSGDSHIENFRMNNPESMKLSKENKTEGVRYCVQPSLCYSSTKKYRVCVKKVTVRSGPGTKYRPTGTLWSRDEIDVLYIKKGWAKFKVDSGWNYIPAKAIVPNNSEESTKYTVTAYTVFSRSGPGYKYSIIGTLKRGNYVYVKSIKKGWAKFKVKSEWNYVRASNLKKASKKR